MKLTKYLTVAAASALCATGLYADATINITGSSAFRAAVVRAIQNAMPSYTAAYTGSSLAGGNQQIIVGSFPGISGVTTIRTSWNGSVEGVRALAGLDAVQFIPTGTATSAGAGTVFSGTLVTGTPSFAFSDVYQDSTGVADPVFDDTNVGVVAFRWVANEGATGVTNISTQIANQLFPAGRISKQFFTGLAADANKNVYLTGRYNGSGTRASAVAEAGYGLFDAVRQYYVETSGVNGTINALRLWPSTSQGTVSGGTNDAIAGNGGYSSGSGIRDVIGCTMAASVSIKNSGGTVTSTDTTATLLSYLGVSDAAASQAAGHVDLTYNGFDYSVDNVRNGKYTFWGVQHLLATFSALTPQETVFYNALTGFEVNYPTRGGLSKALTDLAAAAPGVRLEDMTVTRATTDGSVVGPGVYDEPPAL